LAPKEEVEPREKVMKLTAEKALEHTLKIRQILIAESLQRFMNTFERFVQKRAPKMRLATLAQW
jgi:hypothetical protein